MENNLHIEMSTANAVEPVEVKKPELCLTVANSEELKAEVKAELETIAKTIQPVNHTHYHVESLDISDEAVVALAKESTKKSLIDRGFHILRSAIIMGGLAMIFKSLCMPSNA